MAHIQTWERRMAGNGMQTRAEPVRAAPALLVASKGMALTKGCVNLDLAGSRLLLYFLVVARTVIYLSFSLWALAKTSRLESEVILLPAVGKEKKRLKLITDAGKRSLNLFSLFSGKRPMR